MTFSVTARASTASQESGVILTPRKGPAIVLTVAEAWDLDKAIRNAVQSIERSERTAAVESKVRTARKAERELRRPAAVDEMIQELDA